jgi:hypothetical protein
MFLFFIKFFPLVSHLTNMEVHGFQVSLPNAGESTIDFMNAIYTIMQSRVEGYNLWQVCSQDNKFLNCIFHIFPNLSDSFVHEIL